MEAVQFLTIGEASECSSETKASVLSTWWKHVFYLNIDLSVEYIYIIFFMLQCLVILVFI